MNSVLGVARLIDVCGSIDGRKKLQKMVYLLQQMGYRDEFPQEFGYLHYGPYSRELKREIDWLCASDTALIEEESHPGPSPEAVSYSYKPKAILESLFTELGISGQPGWAGHARDLATKDAPFLEAIATVVYLRKKGRNEESVRKEFAVLKPSLVGRLDAAEKAAKSLVPM